MRQITDNALLAARIDRRHENTGWCVVKPVTNKAYDCVGGIPWKAGQGFDKWVGYNELARLVQRLVD